MRVQIITAPIRAAQESIHRTELLGIEYLAAAVRKAGHEVAIWDPTLGRGKMVSEGLYAFGPAEGEVERLLRNTRPDVLAISCHYGFSAHAAYELAATAKRVDPAMTVVMGGLFVSVNRGLALRECPEIDYALQGEADGTFVQLLTHLNDPEKRSKIDGLIYRDGGRPVTGGDEQGAPLRRGIVTIGSHKRKLEIQQAGEDLAQREGDDVIVNPKHEFIDDLDALSFPARDLAPIEDYMNGSREYQLYGLGFRPALSLLTSRSCPMACTYCNMNLVHGRGWRPRSVESCLEELQEMHDRYGARHVFIMDDYFNLNIDRAKEFADGILRRGLDIRWNTPNGISVKKIDVELAKLWKRAGCASVCIAVESGSEYVRHKIMKKRTFDKEIVNAIECFSAAGVPVVGFVILGMPGENRELIRESIEFIKKLPLTSVVVSFAVPFRGTELYDSLTASGISVPDGSVSIDDYKHPVILPEGVTADEMATWKEELRSSFSRLGILRDREMALEATL